RVYRVRALIGEVVDGVIDNKIKEFYEQQGRSWDPETWTEFLRKIDREAQKRHLVPVTRIPALKQARRLSGAVPVLALRLWNEPCGLRAFAEKARVAKRGANQKNAGTSTC